MREPQKPASEPAKPTDGGALGDMDQIRGSPSKGTPGKTIDQDENPDPQKRAREESADQG